MFAESLFLSLALSSHSLCSQVFQETVMAINVQEYVSADLDGKAEYAKNVKEFADEACYTRNPDVFWLLGYVESSFSFKVIRNNHQASVFRGKKALIQATRLGKNSNFDIGVLQINWKYHGHLVPEGPTALMNPKIAVRTASQIIIDDKSKYCKNWMVCYHNATPAFGKIYAEKLKSAHKILARKFEKVTEERRIVYVKKPTQEPASRDKKNQAGQSDTQVAFSEQYSQRIGGPSPEQRASQHRLRTISPLNRRQSPGQTP